MKLVIDSNILFSFFKKESFTRKLITNSRLELLSPEFAIKELDSYKKLILHKFKISPSEYVQQKKELREHITFVNEKKYCSSIQEAIEISPDPKDIDFLALAIVKNIVLWSNDKKLKEQNIVLVISTNDLITEFF